MVSGRHSLLPALFTALAHKTDVLGAGRPSLDTDPGDGVRAPGGDAGGDGTGGAGTRATVAVAGNTEAGRDEATTMGESRLHDATTAGFAVGSGSAQNRPAYGAAAIQSSGRASARSRASSQAASPGVGKLPS
eukprot:scaffold25524_cov81-Isochrysis_galbana.AAC.1